jgi:putative flippase GtrA
VILATRPAPVSQPSAATRGGARVRSRPTLRGLAALPVGRFALVGLSGIVVNQLTLWAMVDGLGLNYLLGAVLSAQSAIAWNFMLTERWVFGGRRTGAIAPRAMGFALVANATLIFQVPLLALLTAVLGLHYLVSNALSVALGFGLRFLLSDRIIWRPDTTPRLRVVSGGAVAEPAKARAQSSPFWGRLDRALRVPLAVMVVLAAYQYSLVTLLRGLIQEAAPTYLWLVPLVALPLLIWQATAPRRDPNIHDREVDYIVGIALLALALVVLVVVRGRLQALFWLWRVDLVSLPLFVAGVIALLFGLRALWRMRAGVAFLLLAWPPVGRQLLALDDATLAAVRVGLRILPLSAAESGAARFWVLHHGHREAVDLSGAVGGLDGLAGFAVVAVGFALLVQGRTGARVAWLCAGLLVAWLLQAARLLGVLALVGVGGPASSAEVPVRLGGLVASCLALTVMWLGMSQFGLRMQPGWRGARPRRLRVMAPRCGWAVPRAGIALAVVLAAGVAAAGAGRDLTKFRVAAGDLGEPRIARFSPTVDRLPGWSVRRSRSFPAVVRRLGAGATWERYTYKRQRRHDGQAVPVLVADVTSTPDPVVLTANPPEVVYRLGGDPTLIRQVELAPGLTGRLVGQAPGAPGWSMLSWQWPVRAPNSRLRYERVTLIAPGQVRSAARRSHLSDPTPDVGAVLTDFGRRLVRTRLRAANLTSGST